MNVGIVSHQYPTPKRPEAGGFVRDQLTHIARQVDVRLYSPLVNRYWFDRGRFAEPPSFPAQRPLQMLLPGLLWHHLNPSVMAWFMRRQGRKLLDDCDVIHAHTAFPDGCAAIEVYGGIKPVVVTVHGCDVHDFAQRPRHRELIRDALNRAQAIIAVSASLRDMLHDIGVTTPMRIIPNGVDTDLFTPGPKKDACERLGLDSDRLRLLFAGHFVPVKNIPQLIRILPRLRDQHPGLELVLLGGEPGSAQYREVRSLAADANVADMVRIESLRPHTELPDWYRAADAFVLPSRNEGFGLVLAEANACGRPVVATRSGGPESIVEAGTGMLVPHDDDAAFAGAVSTVLAGKGIDTPAELAESIRRRFSFDTLARDVVRVYHEVISQDVQGASFDARGRGA